jgi:hypothetical protein
MARIESLVQYQAGVLAVVELVEWDRLIKLQMRFILGEVLLRLLLL